LIHVLRSVGLTDVEDGGGGWGLQCWLDDGVAGVSGEEA
jgi:hypothetical protein